MKRHQRPVGERSATSNLASRQGRGRDNTRLAIAQLAARLIAEGLADYGAAKQKAARQLGVSDSHALPDNREIELAMREHLSLFAHDTQPDVLQALRETALALMGRLEQFSPWLVGSVLAGTANEFSEIELELVGVEAKNFEMYLLNIGVEFQLTETRRHGDRAVREAIIFIVEFAAAPVKIALYEHNAARQAAHPRDSIKRDRADRSEAQRRFSNASDKL